MTADNTLLRLTEPDQRALVQLLQQLIQFPTEDPPGREIEMARFLQDTLQAWGLDAALDEFEPGRANITARLHGNGTAPGLVFSAHIDTMPAGTQGWTVPPFGGDIHDGKLYGRAPTSKGWRPHVGHLADNVINAAHPI